MGRGGEVARNVERCSVAVAVRKGEGGERGEGGDGANNDEEGGWGSEVGDVGAVGSDVRVVGCEGGEVGIGGSDGVREGAVEAREVRVAAAGNTSGWRCTRGAGMAFTVRVLACSPVQHQQGMSEYHEKPQLALTLTPSNSLTGEMTVYGNMQNWLSFHTSAKRLLPALPQLNQCRIHQ